MSEGGPNPVWLPVARVSPPFVPMALIVTPRGTGLPWQVPARMDAALARHS